MVRARCPDCKGQIRFDEYFETVICPLCGAWYHPEHALPLSTAPPRPALPKVRHSYQGEGGMQIEFQDDPVYFGEPYAVCRYDGCPYKGRRHGALPVQEPVDYENGEPPHPIFVEILDGGSGGGGELGLVFMVLGVVFAAFVLAMLIALNT